MTAVMKVKINTTWCPKTCEIPRIKMTKLCQKARKAFSNPEDMKCEAVSFCKYESNQPCLKNYKS
jgi:hypothetical protein